MNQGPLREGVLDASRLPSYRFSHHSLMWWGTLGLVAIEGTVFGLTIGMYLYLWSQAQQWPLGTPPPGLLWGTLNVALLALSIAPNHWTKKVAEEGSEPKMRLGLVAGSLFGIGLIVVRGLEFTTLNCRWDSDAYGSVVWLLLGLHTVHLVTDVYDTIVLAVLFFAGKPIEGKRHVDVAENAMYWYFVVFSWIPVYAVIYWIPRLSQ